MGQSNSTETEDLYVTGYWDNANGYPKQGTYQWSPLYRQGWKQAKKDTRELVYLANHGR